MADITLSERVYIDAAGRATTNEADGAYLWGTPGMVVKDTEAEAIGYGSKPVPEPSVKMDRTPRRNKAVAGPGHDK